MKMINLFFYTYLKLFKSLPAVQFIDVTSIALSHTYIFSLVNVLSILLKRVLQKYKSKTNKHVT